ncbi:hypothetical protein KY285_006780 [Solanum tuberosum]|nr:hypothetical protein KY289_009312 [Solanum tuberosum]KAH0716009.1 hypothetical protein KY284_008914 [Solanum tuberosum]KAH0745123.1 hypothetical protein KY285_006780 [Solanum tuberosum]
MESNCVQGKIFVGGISAETSEEILTQHFSRYGEVVKSQVIKFRETNCGKGFGFVTFADSSVINQLLHQQHIILGRTVDVKLAIPKGASPCSECQQSQRQNSETSNSNRRKIFVGGLPLSLSEEEFKTYFEKFGTISQVNLISDKETKTPRGFGFVTYDSEESVTHVLQEKLHWLKNKYVEVKKAEPRERRVMNSYYHNFYPTNSGNGMWQIYDCNNGIFAPHYCHNHTMNNVINEGNDQECNNTEVQLVRNGSLPVNESAKPLEKETGNGEKDDLEKIPQDNTKENNGEKDDLVKIPQDNTKENNGEKDDLVKIPQDNTKENNGGKDHFVKILQVNTEDDT